MAHQDLQDLLDILAAVLEGKAIESPYSLSEMTADTVGLMRASKTKFRPQAMIDLFRCPNWIVSSRNNVALGVGRLAKVPHRPIQENRSV